jgi:hypothetical protein
MSIPNTQWLQTTLSYPHGLPQIMKMSEGEFVEEMRFMAAA